MNHSDKTGFIALMDAAGEGHEKATELLLADERVDVNQRDKFGWTALMFAAHEGHEKVVHLLLEWVSTLSMTTTTQPSGMLCTKDMRRWCGCSWKTQEWK